MGIPDSHRTLRPGDVESYDLTLDTEGLPVGPYNTTLTLRTGDPANPGGTVLVTGEIVAGTSVVQPVTDYPLYLDVAIPGEHSQGEWVSFAQNIGADPENLHPLYVYSQSEDLLGVGKYATAFSTGMAAYDIFGDGRDGDLTVNSNQTTVINQTRVSVSASDIFASPDNSNGFKVGDLVLFHQTQGTENTGLWELNHIIAINSPTSWTLAKSLNYVYDNTNGQSQVIKVPQYRNVTVNNGGTLTMPSWDGLTGGILIFLANGDVVVKGTISANGGAGLVTYTEVSPGGTGGGFRGGSGNRSPEGESHVRPYTGESERHPSLEGDPHQGGPTNGNAGTAAAFNNGNLARSGGGGSYGTSGNPGTASRAGIIVGEASLTHLFFGGGGGGGGRGHNVGNGVGSGGAGGAAVAILSRNLMVNGGVITARGGNAGIDTNTSGQWHEGGGASGGAGAGGSILLKVGNATLEENQVIAVGGKGTTATGGLNGNGGDGRIRIEYCESLSGSTNPAASTEKLDCYIIEQIESSPYNTARLNLPESFSGGRTYRVQYGRRLVFNGAANELTTLRVPAREAAMVTLDALVSDMLVDNFTLKLDIGNNGEWDWQGTRDYSGSTTLSALDLTDAFNAYWVAQGKPVSGDMDVPVRVSLNAPGQVLLTNLYTPPVLDLSVSTSDVAFTVSPTVESEIVPVDVTLHNDGGVDPGGFMVAFYAESQTIKGNSQSYVGSAFVPGIPAGSTAQASFDWNTFGFTGTTALHVVVDPYGHLNEANKNNNEAVAALPILTRPDIVVDEIMLSDDEPVVGEEVVVTLKLHNAGQAPAGTQLVALHQGAPESGLLLDTRTQKSLKGGETASLSFTWIPAATGQYRLFATGDRDNTINEFDEGNNRTWRDVYVGLDGPLALDGGSGSEQVYTPELGFGVLDEGLPDVIGGCPSAPLSAGIAGKTHRRDPDGRLVYRFDHLLPGHYYHLDVTLYECDHAGRQERIYIDDNLVAGPEDLGDGQAHRLSLLVDPVFYSDHSIRVTVEAPGTDGAIISHISLHDIGYRYVDAGGAESPVRITAGDLGGEWLDGVDNTDWGTFSRQSVRVDQNDAELRYRFNNLNSHKRYRLHFTFYQPSGQIHVQRVKVDGIDVGLTVNTGDYTVHRETVRVPLLAYVEDGSLVVSIIRLNALSGAMVNEIILEEETLPTEALCQPDITPNFTDVLGDVLLNGEDAPPGTIIQAINPRGDTVGCYLMDESGRYGMMRIYGEDTSVSPPVTGMRNGEMVAFYVDGAPAVSAPLHNWQDDKLTHRVDLNAGGIEGQSILMRAGWNLISFRYEPPVPLVARTLDSIQGRFSHVLGENGIYVPSLSPVYQSLTQLHTGEAYYTYITGTTSVNLLVEGTIISPNTEISLHSGWNWIGYLHDTEMPVTTALQSIDGQYQRVLGLDKTFDPTYPDYSTLKNLQPGDGYLIYMTQKAILTYPSDGRQSNQFDVRQIIGSCDYVNPTPYMTLVFGQVTVNGEPAPVGTHVDVLTPQGDVVGCFVVDTPGKLSLTHVYGADDSVSPTIPGFKPGETLTFQVNGLPVTETTIDNDIWADDKTPRYVELHATSHPLYLPLVMRQ